VRKLETPSASLSPSSSLLAKLVFESALSIEHRTKINSRARERERERERKWEIEGGIKRARNLSEKVARKERNLN